MDTTKGFLNSQTIISIVLLAITALGQWAADNIEVIQTYLSGLIPEPWNSIVPLLMPILITILSLLGIQGRKNATGGLSGLWKSGK